jgi:hypothetical protein
MGIANYTNMSELMNDVMQKEISVSISNLVREAEKRRFVLASEGELADRADLENGFIALFDVHYRAGRMQPVPENETQSRLIESYKNGDLAKNGYGGSEGDLFLEIKWTALTADLPVITNITL